MRQKHIRSDQSSCQTIPAAFEVSKEGGGGKKGYRLLDEK